MASVRSLAKAGACQLWQGRKYVTIGLSKLVGLHYSATTADMVWLILPSYAVAVKHYLMRQLLSAPVHPMKMMVCLMHHETTDCVCCFLVLSSTMKPVDNGSTKVVAGCPPEFCI